jgi:transposase
MPQPNDLSRSLVALDQDSTIIAVVELSQSSWLVAGVIPGIERQPRKKLEPSAERLLGLLYRAMRRSGPVKRSRGLRLPSKPAATASGWRAG